MRNIGYCQLFFKRAAGRTEKGDGETGRRGDGETGRRGEIFYLLFAICYLLFAICYLLFAICYLLFASVAR
ncbi:MAG: hypothetical protein DMF60_12360 [Acidobacteria bacterium]|nr:MAG: hypothetical protein DMF60_12360 [Acidobacteriota bacterium]